MEVPSSLEGEVDSNWVMSSSGVACRDSSRESRS